MTVPPIAYRVELGSGAWKQVATLNRNGFQKLMDALRAIAAEAPEDPALGENHVSAGELTAVYVVNHERALVLVVDILRRLPEAS